MDCDQPSTSVPDRRIALLIDADNVAHGKIGSIVAELSKYGTANVRRAYGDWASTVLQGWKGKLHEFAIRPIQQFSYSPGKNATDIAMVIDAMELLYTQKFDAFCLASSDADFTPLVMQLRANGHEVYGFGERQTPEPFVNACSTFLYLDGIEDASTPAESPDSGLTNKPKAKASSKAVAKSKSGPATSVIRKHLSQNTKLVTVLRGGVTAEAREDGWALMSAAGSAAKRQAPIDPRNYGVKNFPALFEATGLFDIRKVDGGDRYIADKRNRDRSSQPLER